jgi:hypothetical protein
MLAQGLEVVSSPGAAAAAFEAAWSALVVVSTAVELEAAVVQSMGQEKCEFPTEVGRKAKGKQGEGELQAGAQLAASRP